MSQMIVLVLAVVLALLVYMYLYIRSELYRLSEKQTNSVMHIARMNRGMLEHIAEMMQPPGARPSPAGEEAAAGALETVVEEDEPAAEPVAAVEEVGSAA